ncbi:FHA domain-containing protein [Ktedonobacteria bacterium brp13]|nr:FHA domain-containing protein [Ktedonobacteria bacterium brp13]
MDARFYNSEDIDVQRLAGDLVNVYLSQGYQAQQIGNNDQMMVQLKKGGDFEAIIGMQAAISVTIQRTTGGVLAMIGQQRWIDKAAVGAVGLVAFPILWPLALTAGAGALRQASLGNQVLNVVDGLVHQQRPGVLPGPVPQFLLPQAQQHWGQPPNQQQGPYYIPSNQAANPPAFSPAQQPYQAYQPGQPAPMPAPTASDLRCPHCNTPYEAGDTFCTGCGRPLTAAQPNSYSNTVNAAPPLYQPPVQPATPVYQPPVQPATPVYQPPVQPATPPYQPPVTQTPAAPPPSQVYYVPSSQNPAPAATPQTTPQAPKKPEEPYYVPPVTQEPSVKPQPKVTMVPGQPHQTPPPPKSQPRPQKQYYIPSNPEAQDAVSQAQQNAAAQPTVVDQSRVDAASQPTVANQPVVDSGAPWGTLAFENGLQQQLAGERVVIGRYDHDLGGIQPEIDLAKLAGADTVSRVHATLEHIGSSYQLTDLNSTNATRINGKRLEPDNPQPVNDGDTLTFGKINCTFHKA